MMRKEFKAKVVGLNQGLYWLATNLAWSALGTIQACIIPCQGILKPDEGKGEGGRGGRGRRERGREKTLTLGHQVSERRRGKEGQGEGERWEKESHTCSVVSESINCH